MLVIITALKAPWPAGARVGSIVDLPHASIPSWCVGKCAQAAEDAVAEFVWEPPSTTAAPASASTVSTEAHAALKAELAAAQAEVAELGQKLAQANADLEAGGLALQDALAQIDALKASQQQGDASLQAAEEQAQRERDAIAVRDREAAGDEAGGSKAKKKAT